MEYEKQVKALRCDDCGSEECTNSECPYYGFGCLDGKMCKDADDAIEALQADNDILHQHIEDLNEAFRSESLARQKAEAAQPHWVSVKDELPEIDKRVLVSYGGWTQIMSRRDDGDKICEKYWENEEGLWERVLDDSYWMPLPEPPQEVQDGE